MWKLQFIKEEDLFTHVEQTIIKYGEKLNSINLESFNKNIIDPVKSIFDKMSHAHS